LTLNDAIVSGFISDKALGLFCYLALNPGPHARGKLADLLWSDFSADRARANLRQAISNLQKLLPGYLEVNRKTAQFMAKSPHAIDVLDFSHRVDDHVQGHIRPADLEAEAAADMRQAEVLFRGEFLAEFFVDGARGFESWLTVERERLNLQRLALLLALGDRSEDRRDYVAAIKRFEQAVQIEPWQERTHRRLMLLYARTGAFEPALAQFNRCREVLSAELEVEPTPETMVLYERIRAARTRGRTHPPAQPDPLVGRTRVLSQVLDLLSSGPARLVSLLGIGGAGKTRLAVAVMEGLGAAFLEGAYFIPLVSVSDGEGARLAIARALGLRVQGQGDINDQLISFLRNKEILLVLDNLEHLVGEFAFLETILEGAPDVRILATSRRRLNLRWEDPVFLEGLGVGSPESVLEYPAGQLFLRSSRRVRPDFVPTAADGQAIHQVCTLVEGLPLAIQLSAVWLRLFSCSQILAKMQSDERFIQQASREGLDRHTSLQAAFDHSWHLLLDTEQSVFLQLTAFRGGFDDRSARSVAGARPEDLAALADMSLLRKTAQDRYEIHELLRQFGEVKLAAAPGQAAAAHRAHAHYFLEWLAARETKLTGVGLDPAADQIQLDWDNVRRSWLWAIEHADFDRIENGFWALYEFCGVRQYFREGRELLSAAWQAVRAAPKMDLLAARLRSALGGFDHYVGLVEEALQAYHATRPVLKTAELTHDLAVNLMWTGFSTANAGKTGALSEGQNYLEQALAIFEAQDNSYYRARTMGNLGNNLFGQGDYVGARDYYRQSLTIFEDLGILWGQAGALAMLGKLEQQVSGQPHGKKEMERALAIGRQIENLHVVSVSLAGLSALALEAGDRATARDWLQEALDAATTLGQDYHVADLLGQLGHIASLSGEAERADAFFERSLALMKKIGSSKYYGLVLMFMGIHARDEGDPKQAAACFRQALDVELSLDQQPGVINTLVEVVQLACTYLPTAEILPDLQNYLANHTLTTELMRERLTEGDCEPVAREVKNPELLDSLSLEQIVRRIQKDLIGTQVNWQIS
jgi:predicted ATPase/DNA-binding SARP family transcriptional activator